MDIRDWNSALTSTWAEYLKSADLTLYFLGIKDIIMSSSYVGDLKNSSNGCAHIKNQIDY